MLFISSHLNSLEGWLLAYYPYPLSNNAHSWYQRGICKTLGNIILLRIIPVLLMKLTSLRFICISLCSLQKPGELVNKSYQLGVRPWNVQSRPLLFCHFCPSGSQVSLDEISSRLCGNHLLIFCSSWRHIWRHICDSVSTYERTVILLVCSSRWKLCHECFILNGLKLKTRRFSRWGSCFSFLRRYLLPDFISTN